MSRSSDGQARPDVSCGVAAAFAWSSPGVVANSKWHVFVSTVDANGGYSMAYGDRSN